MKHIDEERLDSDLGYRFEYLVGFVGFGEEDIAAIHGAASHDLISRHYIASPT